VRAVVVSPDGGTVIAARANQVHLFDAKSGSHVRSFNDSNLNSAHLAIVEALALSPDGKLLATGSYQEAAIWDVATGKLLRKLTGFADRVVALSFSPDGKLLATGGGMPTVDGEVKIFEVTTGKLVNEIAKAHSDTVCGIAFSPDGTKLATASADLSVKVFAVPDGKLLRKLDGHAQQVLDVAWKPDGKTLASAGTDRVVKLWDYERGEQLTKLGRSITPNNDPMNLEHTQPVCRVGFVGDTWQVVSAGGNQPVRVWKIEEAMRASADKKELYRGHSVRVLRSLGDGRDYLYALGLNADGSRAAVGGEDGIVRVYDTVQGQLLHELVPPGGERPKGQP
jgi:WD40 repeat protein